MKPIRIRTVAIVACMVAVVVGLTLLSATRDGTPTAAGDTTLPGPTDTSTESSTSPTSVPASTTTFADPTTSTTLPPPVVIAAAGDLSCRPDEAMTRERCRAPVVSDALLALPDLQHFLALGDVQYRDGTSREFRDSYDGSYGRLKDRTRPVAGNHEYGTPDAAGYFEYFGTAAGSAGEGWYSFDVGSTWHVVALNSNCSRVGCEPGSAQEQWLREDVAASDRPCTLAFWHHPLFSTGSHHGNDPRMTALWHVLQDDGAEIVLVGHDHVYERFAPQTVDGTASADGIRQIVVGTGGRSLHPFADVPAANSEVRLLQFGYLRVSLADTGYTFEFVGEDGTVLDSGAGTCSIPPPEPTPEPTVPPSTPPST